MSRRQLIERIEALRDRLEEVRTSQEGLSPKKAAAAMIKVFRSEMERNELGRPSTKAYKKGDLNIAVVTYPRKLQIRITSGPGSNALRLAVTPGTAFSPQAADEFSDEMRSRYGYTTRRPRNRQDPDLAGIVLPATKQIPANLREVTKHAKYIANILLDYVIYP